MKTTMPNSQNFSIYTKIPEYLNSSLGSGTENSGIFILVPMAGLEPARLAALDFESSTSTNSITSANIKYYITNPIQKQ